MASTASIPRPSPPDPDNRLLHRMPVRRLEAEAIATRSWRFSGRLDRREGGPPSRSTSRRSWTTTTPTSTAGPRAAARSTAMGGAASTSSSGGLHDADARRLRHAPAPEHGGPADVSNVPAQALILMNDPFVAGPVAGACACWR